jgi:sugar phosphate isomerase/epimerase
MTSSALPELAIHTITTRPWSLEECVSAYAAAGVRGVTLWRYHFETVAPRDAGSLIRDAGMVCSGLARGGFFPAPTAEGRRLAVEENLRAIDEAAACGAPVLVLVCGALPGQALTESRQQIAEGIAQCLDHAAAAGVRLAIEPLHPMYAADRSAIVTMGQANDVCDLLGSPAGLGLAVDVYHVWWDPDLAEEIARAGAAGRLFAYHVCDWRIPTEDLLNDRGLMGEGPIPLRAIRAMMEQAGFRGFSEVEIFSDRRWKQPQDQWLAEVVAAWQQHCGPPGKAHDCISS